jgi:hypothetical protein
MNGRMIQMATHFKGPLLNSATTGLADRAWFKKLPIGVEPDLCMWMKDWLTASELDAAADWVVTQIDGGGDTDEVFAVAADALHGELTITTNDADNDASSAQTANEFVALETGKRLWFEARWKIEKAADSDVLVGLSINDTTPLDASKRINFKLTEGSAALAFETDNDTVETVVPAIATLADNTYVKTGFLWDGSSKLEVYIDRDKVAEITTGIPTAENLAINLRVQTGEAAPRTLTVDYIMVAKER